MTTTQKQKIETLATDLAELSHERGSWALVLWDDGDLSIVEGETAGTGTTVLSVGTGSGPCDCDACSEGATGGDRVGDDDITTMVEQIKDALELCQC
jgi:hypothetical protein